MKILVLLLFYSFSILAEINHETHDFSFEYGLGYHTLRGVQKDNNSKGTLTSSQNPYWLGSYTLRLGSNFGLKAFGGVHVVRFNEPKYGTLKDEDQLLNQFGLELIHKLSPLDKLGFFLMQQDHPLYYAKTPTDFEVVKKAFVQAGVHYSIGQRRRIGLLWGLGAKAYTIFPAQGGDVATEAGVGGEAETGQGDPGGPLIGGQLAVEIAIEVDRAGRVLVDVGVRAAIRRIVHEEGRAERGGDVPGLHRCRFERSRGGKRQQRNPRNLDRATVQQSPQAMEHRHLSTEWMVLIGRTAG